MDHEAELLKTFANRVAQFSASPKETQAVRNLQISGIFAERQRSDGGRIEGATANLLNVGIWKRENESDDAVFVRRSDLQGEWFFWASRERIEPKNCKWRVALLGESVARGFLYDPEFTPALALESMLRAHLGATEIDVVDLAKSNLTIEQLETTVEQCLALSPDVVVILAGNNWRPHLTEGDIPYVDSLLREGGVPAMKSFLDARAEQAVRQLTGRVNELLNSRNVKVIWVVPEFNLDAWTDPVSDAPLLTGDGNERWCDLKRRASQAMLAGDLSSAESLAKELFALDGGTNAVPLRMLAEICRSRRDLQGARRYLELCRDAEGWDPSFSYSPRVSSTIQSALRDAATSPKSLVVDLPDVFGAHAVDELPGRQLFADYCHLTAFGINVAMAAVASKVLVSLTGQVMAAQSIQNASAPVPSQVEGKACFLAAVHNAHFYQSFDLVSYWCDRALQLWPECAKIMVRLIDFQTRRVPLMACKSLIELFAVDELDTLRYLLRGGKKRLDLLLSDALVKSLAAIGVDIENDVKRLRADEHSLRTGPKDLTDFYYSSTMLSDPSFGWTSRSFSDNRASHCMYASAFLETSKFIFFGEKGRPVGVKLAYRIQNDLKPEGRVKISANGHALAQAPVGSSWRTFETTIAGDKIVDGLNEIEIKWPADKVNSEVALGNAADSLLARRLPRFYKTHGEIHALVVYDARERLTDSRLNYSTSSATQK